ncbi:MAG: hypothetical protein ABI806_26930, partial [Candidatus Solibacter sp.]
PAYDAAGSTVWLAGALQIQFVELSRPVQTRMHRGVAGSAGDRRPYAVQPTLSDLASPKLVIGWLPVVLSYCMPSTSDKVLYDPSTAGLETARQIVFSRLRADRDWHQLDKTGDGFSPFVEYLEGREGRWHLTVLANEVFWLLLGEGILSPGMDYSNPNLPWFHITSHGRNVLASAEPQPYDPTGYLTGLRGRISAPDPTVLAYIAESLETFRKDNLVASTVMLGIAAERVFLLLCASLERALIDPAEKAQFTKVLSRFSMKPKLDWVHDKIQKIQKRPPAGFPENATIMIVAIYDLMRGQRNELGHPRELPPCVKREDAFVNLQIFPRYYEIAEQTTEFLASNPV